MITTPNDISNCILWLDSHDRTTLFQNISVNSTQRRNLYVLSDSIQSVSRGDIWTTDTNWMRTFTTAISAPNNSSATTWTLVDGFQYYNGSDRWIRIYQYAPRTATYTLSFFVKNNGHRYIYFTFDGVASYVDLNTGIVSGTTGGVTVLARAASTDFPSTPAASTGWYRVYLTKTLTASTTPKELQIRPSTTNTTAGWTNRTNDPGKGFAIWGIMLEESGTLGSYIHVPTIEGAFEDRTRVAPATVPISPVTSGNQRIAYWRNKSLSASALQLSGVQVFDELSDLRPILSTSNNITSVYFDYSYLSTPVLPIPIDTSSQTVFAVMNIGWDNASEENNRAFISQALSGRSFIGTGGSANNYAPLVIPYSYSPCSIVGGASAVSFFPSTVSWLVRNPVQYNRVTNTANKDNLYVTSIYRATKHLNNTFSCAWNRINNEYGYGEGPVIWDTNNRSGRYTTPTLSSVSATDIFRLGTGINSTTLDHSWSLFWPLQRPNMSYRGTWAHYYEVIIYNRELTKDEIDDVEDYLTRRWIPSPRQVWALSDGELSSSNIFSISSELAPFNVLLSSDVIYTNGYTLTATANQSINVITNMPTPVTGRAGGCVIMTEGVTLSAKVIGGSSPGAVVVPENVKCTIVGNTFGGYSRLDTALVRPASALNVPGVYISPGGYLALSGSSYGGFEVNSPGISINGGSFDYTGILEGSGFRGYSVHWSSIGGLRGFGVSAINTNLVFNNKRIQSGLHAAGLFTNNCTVQLNNCIIESTYNGLDPYLVGPGADRYGNTAIHGNVCYSCNNTYLTATNTMFLGTTSTAVGPFASQGSVVASTAQHSGTALWGTGSSQILLNNCYIEGSRRIAAQDGNIFGGMRNSYLGLNQAIRLSSFTTLTGVNCTINGARNANFDYESSTGKVGVYIDNSAAALFLNSTVNAEPNIVFSRGIYNNGILQLFGTVRGGYRAVGTSYPGIYNRGTLYVNGFVAPNYSGSVAIDNESNGTAYISGNIRPGGPLCNTVTSRGMLTAFYSEPLISSLRGFIPIQAYQCVFVSLCSTSLYNEFSVDGVQTVTRYLDKNFNLNLPLSADVLQGYVYGPLGSQLTGTSIIPEVSATIIGVPVRSIYGSARPLTVDAFWNQPPTAVTSLSGTIPIPLSATIFTKFINPMTSVSLSAIAQSLTDIPPAGI